MKIVIALMLLMLSCARLSQAQTVEMQIKPSVTDPRIQNADEPHVVRYTKAAKQTNLLVFLPGTNGKAAHGPENFYKTVTDERLRLIALSYVDGQSVSQVCTIRVSDERCAAHFREKRLFGHDVTPLISDEPADAVVNRLTKLLQYLVKTDPEGDWDQYLIGGAPRWNRIIVSGQSQGGGMAAFLAKKFAVAKVLMFSGGWDNGATPNSVASWYSDPSATPPKKWFATYHVLEPKGKFMARTYRALGIPVTQIFALDEAVPNGKNPHVQGVHDQIYKPIWTQMLASNPRSGQVDDLLEN